MTGGPASEGPVPVARDGPIARLTLNRPERRNALDPELAGALASAIEAASGDPDVRVIVLTGAGSAFCAGARLDDLLAASERGDSTAVAASFGAVGLVDLPPELLSLLRYGRGVDNRRLKAAGFDYRYTAAGAVESFAEASRLRRTVGQGDEYRYERDVENFFRHSPAVIREP